MGSSKPVIVIKKKSGHGGSHGGAWKVAYADFVTALMSLFIVLWLMGSSEKVKQAVAGYFNDPSGKSTMTGTDQSGSADNLALTKDNIPDLKKKIEEAIRKMNDLKALQNQIQITITPEGLRIELLETKDGTFFDSGSAKLNKNGQELLEMLAGQLGGLPNRISIEGHTDAQPFASKDGYGNWDLSTDRANAARRVMQASGLGKSQVSQVRGYADQKLRVPTDPLDPSNRRVSLIVQYLTVDSPPVPASGKAPPGAGGEGAKPGKDMPSQELPAPGGGVPKAGAAGDAKPGAVKSGAVAQPGGGQPQPGGTKPGVGQSGGPPVQKPSAATPATANVVSKLWQKIHSKK
jgi:chemotaxis protein MotB